MKINFVGATKHVTGSCSWLYHPKTNQQFLVDCGMHQGGDVDYKNELPFPFQPSEIRFVLLTHAHLDHCGLIPKLYKNGFKGKIYCTQATAKLATIILNDSARIQESPYSNKDVEKVRFHHVDDSDDFMWGKTISINASGIRVSFLRNSHILGASGIVLAWGDSPESPQTFKSICFSGDIGNNTRANKYLPMMKANQYAFGTVNYMLVESTYGGTVRDSHYKDSELRAKTLQSILNETILAKKGQVLIPSFSVHRAQEILVDLVAWLKSKDLADLLEEQRTAKKKTNPQRFNILLQSPMATKVCQVFSEEIIKKTANGNWQYLTDTVENYFPEGDIASQLKNIFSIKESKNKLTGRFYVGDHAITITSKPPKDTTGYHVIISSSGMCDSGSIVNYLDEMESDQRNTIMLCGFQSPGTRGARLAKLSELPEEKNKQGIFADIVNMSSYYSGHADQTILLDYIFNLSDHRSQTTQPATLFLNHGNKQSKSVFLEAIKQRSSQKYDTDRPIQEVLIAGDNAEKDWFDLEANQFVHEGAPAKMNTSSNDNVLQEILNELKMLNSNLGKRQVDTSLET